MDPWGPLLLRGPAAVSVPSSCVAVPSSGVPRPPRSRPSPHGPLRSFLLPVELVVEFSHAFTASYRGLWFDLNGKGAHWYRIDDHCLACLFCVSWCGLYQINDIFRYWSNRCQTRTFGQRRQRRSGLQERVIVASGVAGTFSYFLISVA